MKTLTMTKGISMIIAFFCIYTVLDIFRIYFFLGERGLSFGDYDLNYLSRFIYSFNLPIKDIKVLVYINIIIFSIIFCLSLIIYLISKFNFILKWLLYAFLILNTVSIIKTFTTILTIQNTTTKEYLQGLIFTFLIYILFEFVFFLTIKGIKKE
ncbi:hypothetical protein [Flavobacterium petrolei]|uniref:hypothetical protein n=1 Tax=Flavobacterium petrolei TaxID=2259594 RepID=UPI003756F189